MIGQNIQVIGEILIKIGERAMKDPGFLESLIKFIEDTPETVEQSTTNEKIEKKDVLMVDTEKIEQTNFYTLAREKNEEELEAILNQFNKEEIKYIFKKHHLGLPKTQSEPKMKKFLVDQFKKRIVDVFLDKTDKVNQ